MISLSQQFKRSIFWGLMCLPSFAIAQSSDSTMSEKAKSAQKMQNVLYPQIQLPFTYNYNQKLGVNSNSQQNQYAFNPIIPVALGGDWRLIVNPMLTVNRNVTDQQVTNQSQPLQLATYLGPARTKSFYAGIGPYFQLPADNANNGSKQMGLGISASTFFAPEHWVMGAVIYNSWGVGSNMSGGSANLLNVQPSISYTTDAAWTYSLGSQVVYNYDSRMSTNQLTFSGGKTIDLFGHHTQIQVGPTYMVTTTPTSARGFGGFLGLTVLMPK
jgi:hypothetical protein